MSVGVGIYFVFSGLSEITRRNYVELYY